MGRKRTIGISDLLKHFKQHPHTTKALAYAYDVIKGHRLSGKYERLACQRFIDDLKNANSRWWYAPSKAERACEFVERMPHTKGRWAARREKLVLEGGVAMFHRVQSVWMD